MLCIASGNNVIVYFVCIKYVYKLCITKTVIFVYFIYKITLNCYMWKHGIRWYEIWILVIEDDLFFQGGQSFCKNSYSPQSGSRWLRNHDRPPKQEIPRSGWQIETIVNIDIIIDTCHWVITIQLICLWDKALDINWRKIIQLTMYVNWSFLLDVDNMELLKCYSLMISS